MKPAAAAIAGLLALSAAPFAAAQAQSGKSRKAPSPPARTGYDKSWFISEFWSGEYPAGFSVTRKSTILMARSAMDKNLPRSVACAMPYLAVIHPWNTRRNQKSKVTYWSASRIVNLIAKEDFVFEFGLRGNSDQERRCHRIPPLRCGRRFRSQDQGEAVHGAPGSVRPRSGKLERPVRRRGVGAPDMPEWHTRLHRPRRHPS